MDIKVMYKYLDMKNIIYFVILLLFISCRGQIKEGNELKNHTYNENDLSEIQELILDYYILSDFNITQEGIEKYFEKNSPNYLKKLVHNHFCVRSFSHKSYRIFLTECPNKKLPNTVINSNPSYQEEKLENGKTRIWVDLNSDFSSFYGIKGEKVFYLIVENDISNYRLKETQLTDFLVDECGFINGEDYYSFRVAKIEREKAIFIDGKEKRSCDNKFLKYIHKLYKDDIVDYDFLIVPINATPLIPIPVPSQ